MITSFLSNKARNIDFTEIKTLKSSNRKIVGKSNKLVIIGMAESSHLHRWIEVTQSVYPRARLLLFPSDSPNLTKDKLRQIKGSHPNTRIFRLFPNARINYVLNVLFDYFLGQIWRAFLLRYLLLIHRPKVIHFHEIQHGAYIYNYVHNYRRTHLKSRYIISTWGSDLYLYHNLESHKKRIQECLKWADVITAERKFEKEIVEKFDFSGEFIAPVYITVGQSQNSKPKMMLPSLRKTIIIKGYQDQAGRALNVLNALAGISDVLRDFEILVFSASDSILSQVELINCEYGLNIAIVNRIPHSELQDIFRRSRLYIGMSISDGLSTSMVEAMEAGTFPIQSPNSAAGDFLEDKKSGFIVDPWNIDGLRESIRMALTDDNLVDDAARINSTKLASHYSYLEGVRKIKSLYSGL
jgi:glycosyltransferase involved in cell wall biosynthesis